MGKCIVLYTHEILHIGRNVHTLCRVHLHIIKLDFKKQGNCEKVSLADLVGRCRKTVGDAHIAVVNVIVLGLVGLKKFVGFIRYDHLNIHT